MASFQIPTPTKSVDVSGGQKPGDDPTPNSLASNQPVKMLDQKHPVYAANYDAWLDLSILYEGGVAMKKHASRMLKMRPREDTDVFAARVERFTYQNILGTALGWYISSMFEETPQFFFNNKAGQNIDSKNKIGKFYSEFLGNCDGSGTLFTDFFKRVLSSMLTYGSAWVLTDLKALGEDEQKPSTLEEERSRGLLDPHVVAYSPMDVINWECDAEGCLEWVVVKVSKQENGFLKKPTIVDTWYYYDREKYYVYRDRREITAAAAMSGLENRMAEFISSGNHALFHKKRVPVRRIHLSENLWLANRAYLILIDHLNQDNTLAWALFMSNLAIPVIIGDIDTSNMTQSESGYLQFPSGTSYQWSEPDGKSFQHAANRLDSLREEAFRCMYLQSQGRSMHATPAMQSGRSKQLEMAPATDMKTGMGGDVRAAMQNVLIDVVDARHDNESVVPDVRGFIFEDDMTTEEVFAVTSLLSLRIPSKRFEKYIYKKVAHAWMPDANREEQEAIDKEIDEGPTMEDREKKEQQERIEMAKAGMASAVKKASGGPTQPPGRGGAGPSPNKK